MKVQSNVQTVGSEQKINIQINQSLNIDPINQEQQLLRKSKRIAAIKQKSQMSRRIKKKNKLNMQIQSKMQLLSKNSQKSIITVNMNKSLSQRNEPGTISQQVIEFFTDKINQYLPIRQQNSLSTSLSTKLQQKRTCIKINQNQVLIEKITKLMSQFQKRNEIKVVSLLQNTNTRLFSNRNQQNSQEDMQKARQFIVAIQKKFNIFHQSQICNSYHINQNNKNSNYNQNIKNSKLIKQRKNKLNYILKDNRSQSINQLCYFQVDSTNDQYSLQNITQLEKQYLMRFPAFNKIWKSQICTKINEPIDMKRIAKYLLILSKTYNANLVQTNKCFQTIKQNINFQETKIKTQYNQMKTQYNQIKKQQSQMKKQQSQMKKPYHKITMHNLSDNNEDFYIKCMIKKCLIKALSSFIMTEQSQFWNFYKLTVFNQNNLISGGFRNQQPYKALTSEQEFKQYIRRIQNKKLISKPILHTSCTACFSNHYELSNPIIKCMQCKSRYHRHCVSNYTDGKCDKCTYKKLSPNFKNQISKCFICMNQSNSLMITKIKHNLYAHNFCLMLHNLYDIRNQRFTVIYKSQEVFNKQNIDKQNIDKEQQLPDLSDDSVGSIKRLKNKISQSQNVSDMIDESDQKKGSTPSKSVTFSNSNNRCKFCYKKTQNAQRFLKNCQNCNQKYHVLCAYLNGCQLNINEWQDTFKIHLNIKCCCKNEQNLIQFRKNKFYRTKDRRFKLNFDKFALNYGSEKIQSLSSNHSIYVTNKTVLQDGPTIQTQQFFI